MGVDHVALAEGVLYPGIDPETLTWPEQWAAVLLAKQYLIDAGLWPFGKPGSGRGKGTKNKRKAA